MLNVLSVLNMLCVFKVLCVLNLLKDAGPCYFSLSQLWNIPTFAACNVTSDESLMALPANESIN